MNTRSFVVGLGAVLVAGSGMALAIQEDASKYAPQPMAVMGTADADPLIPVVIRLKGSGEQSVAAGETFYMDVLLNRRVNAEFDLPLKVFRVDYSDVGSGDVKVLPIVEGSGADEKYWDIVPSVPTIPAGYRGWTNIAVRVKRDAKQPPAGSATPYEPVEFPDHLIFIAETDQGVHSEVLRVREPIQP